jgi:hypothetical protein
MSEKRSIPADDGIHEEPVQASDAQALQILITEHNNLQAMRSATIFEANGRTNLFLGAVSSSIVALAFIGQMSQMGSAFFVFALILLPSLIFIGVVTFVRVFQTGIEDMLAMRGINRIRHYYTEIVPLTEKYFILSAHDDMQGFVQNFGAQDSIWQQFLSTAGLVSVVNSILTAVFVGLLAFSLFQAALLVCVVASVLVFVISIALYMRYQYRRTEENEKHLKVLFPSEDQE